MDVNTPETSPADLKRITELVQTIEKKYDVTIIYLCGYGSRVFGHSQSNSDFDLAGIYVCSRLNYANRSVFPSRGEILEPFDRDRYEFSLWDVSKVLKLFFERRTQVPLLWLRSPVVYHKHEKSADLLHDFLKRKNTNGVPPLLRLCYGEASSAFAQFTRRKSLKKLSFCIYKMFNFEWVLQKNSVGFPFDVNELVKELRAMKSSMSPFLQKIDKFVQIYTQSVKSRSDTSDTSSAAFFSEAVDVVEPELLQAFAKRLAEIESRNPSNDDLNGNEEEVKLLKEEYSSVFQKLIDSVAV